MPVMEHFNVPATARASFGCYSRESDIDALVAALVERDAAGRRNLQRLLGDRQTLIDSLGLVTDPRLTQLALYQLLDELRRLAVECYRAVECSGMARVDFLLESATGKLYINEINTIPGFTSISMYPKMWEASGIKYQELLSRLVDLAIARHERKKILVREFHG